MSADAYSFYKLSPGGNTTVLIMQAEDVPRERHAELAARLMQPLHLGAEQVGYVSMADGVPRLDMMGGEFCGNAARSLVAVLALEGWLTPESVISVSGVPAPLKASAMDEEGVFNAAIEMPVRREGGCVTSLGSGLALVELDGISHLLLDEDEHPCPVDPKAAAARLREQYDLGDREAVGCIWHSGDHFSPSIRPVVWVRETGTTHLETACGSGTMALALLLAKERGEAVSCRVLQPSGRHIEARVVYDGAGGCFSEAWISGPVELIAKGITYL